MHLQFRILFDIAQYARRDPRSDLEPHRQIKPDYA